MSLLSGLGLVPRPTYTPPPPGPPQPSEPVAEPEASSGSGGAHGSSGGSASGAPENGASGSGSSGGAVSQASEPNGGSTAEAGATSVGSATVQPGLRGPALRNAEAARERAAEAVQERAATTGAFVRQAADASESRQQALVLQGSLQAQRVLELMAAPSDEKPSLRLPPARAQQTPAQKPASVSLDV